MTQERVAQKKGGARKGGAVKGMVQERISSERNRRGVEETGERKVWSLVCCVLHA